MADAGASSSGPSTAPAAVPPVIHMDEETFKKIIATFAGSHYNEPQKEKKPQIKKKKANNPKLNTLNKQKAEYKAKLVKMEKEKKKIKLLERKKQAMERMEQRKSLILKDEELIRTVDEKLSQLSDL